MPIAEIKGIKERSPQNTDLEMARLLAAAVISPKFCAILLNDPDEALRQGFNGETFLLSEADVNLLHSMRAISLKDFATQILHAQKPPIK